MYKTKFVAFVVFTMLSFFTYAHTTDPGQDFRQLETFDLDFAVTVGLSDGVAASNDGVPGDDNKTDFTLDSTSYEVTQDAVGVIVVLVDLEPYKTETAVKTCGSKFEVGWPV